MWVLDSLYRALVYSVQVPSMGKQFTTESDRFLDPSVKSQPILQTPHHYTTVIDLKTHYPTKHPSILSPTMILLAREPEEMSST